MSLIVGLNCETARTGRVRFQSFPTSLHEEVGVPQQVAQALFFEQGHSRSRGPLGYAKVIPQTDRLGTDELKYVGERAMEYESTIKGISAHS